MNFQDIAEGRYSCRAYDTTAPVEEEKLLRILTAARLSPSACNSQPYFMTVCRGETAKRVAAATAGVGINGFVKEAPVLIVISEAPYNSTARLGARIKGNDYRSIDIGILAAYLTAAAAAEGLGSCILGWLDDKEIRSICDLSDPVRLVIAVGYPKKDIKCGEKKRKDLEKLVKFLGGEKEK